MTGIINTTAFAKALEPGVHAWYGKAYNEWPVEWDKLFEKVSTRRAWEEEVQSTGMGLAHTIAEGAPVQYEGERQGFVKRYQPYQVGLGFIITEIMIEDNLYAQVAERRAGALAFSMRQTKEINGANVYNRAFNSSYTGADGVELVSASHPNISGGTQSNLASADISELALEQACINIAKWTNDKGLKIAVMPYSLHITPEQEFDVARILRSDGRVATADNDLNALKAMGKFAGGVHVNHYFTDTDAWFIRNKVPHGMKYFERRGDTFGMEDDFDTGNIRFKTTARYDFGWTDWRAVYGSAGV